MTYPWDWATQQARALRDAGHTYEQACHQQATIGLNALWPLLAERLMDEGKSWGEICRELGLDRDPGDDESAERRELIERLENQAATIKQQAATIEVLEVRVAKLTAELTAAKGRAARQRRR